MNANKAILGSFIGCCALITWRDFQNPEPNWPLPAPPPFRYLSAGIAFGLLGLFGDMVNEKIASVLAVGLFVGLAFQTAQERRVLGMGGDPVKPGDPSHKLG